MADANMADRINFPRPVILFKNAVLVSDKAVKIRIIPN